VGGEGVKKFKELESDDFRTVRMLKRLWVV
jgi:hypothetical protein